MLKNYLKIAFRNLLKHKVYSFINICGLAVGVASCLWILLFINDELSYDKFNKNADQIYRVSISGKVNDSEFNSPLSPAPLGPTIMHDLPDVITYSRMFTFDNPVLRYKNRKFNEERFYSVDSTFFDVFTVEFLKGNAKKALSMPNSLVITESMAKKYFGNEEPIGKIITADNRGDWIVTGVVKDFPRNSHFHFDFLASLNSNEDSRSSFWLKDDYITYFVLHKGTDPVEFQKKLNKDVLRYIEPQLIQRINTSIEQIREKGGWYSFNLQPLTSIHLHSNLDYEIEANSNITYIYIFSVLAVAILLIACINFINLATSVSDERAKEVGIRKTLGSLKSQLISQFIVESALMSLVAVALGIILIEILLPFLNIISGLEITFNLFKNYYAILGLIGFAGIIGLITGSYPAFYLSSFLPITVLRKRVIKNNNSILRSGLVILQFSVSIILIIGTLIVYHQLMYIQNKDLGFEKNQVIIINRANSIGEQIEAFKNELLNYPMFIKVSNSSIIPGNQNGSSAYRLDSAPSDQSQALCLMLCDYNFINTYKIKMKEGRFFSTNYVSDTGSVVINDAAVKLFGLKDPVGKTIVKLDMRVPKKYKIIGVTKDFNYESLHQPINPLVFHLLSDYNSGQFLSIRISPGSSKHAISILETIWKKYAGNEVLNYSFLNQDLNHLYHSEQKTKNIAVIFSILAISIACLGLLGLAAFITEQRTKEIGIRKVLGASVLSILIMLSKEFLKWIVIANIIAWPIAYYFMNKWLQDFAYRINISIWIFIMAGVAAIMIALVTVSFQAVKAAVADPVKSLKYE